MPRARISKKQYDVMVEVFREKPGEFTAARHAAKVGHRTAKRAWETGWERPDWARPIRDLIGEEQVAARAQMYEAELRQRSAPSERARMNEEKELARLDVAKERAREAQAVRAALSHSLSLLANLGQFSSASIALSRRAANDLAEEVAKGQVKWREALPFLTKLAWIGSQATSQLKDAMEATRLHLGEPGKIVGVHASGTVTTTTVDPEKMINALGPEGFKAAVVGLLEGEMTPEVERFLALQAEEQAPAPADEVH